VEDVDAIFDEDEQHYLRKPRPSFGKCQSLFIAKTGLWEGLAACLMTLEVGDSASEVPTSPPPQEAFEGRMSALFWFACFYGQKRNNGNLNKDWT